MAQVKGILLILALIMLLSCSSRHVSRSDISIEDPNHIQKDQGSDEEGFKKGSENVIGVDETALFHILAGEIAGQRRYYELAAEHYFQAGLTVIDPAVLNRAKQIVQYAGNEEQLRQFADHWRTVEPDRVDSWLIFLIASLKLEDNENISQAIDQIFLVADDKIFAFEAIIAAISSSEQAQLGYDVLLDYLLTQDENIDPELLLMQGQFAVRLRAYDYAMQLVSKILDVNNVDQTQNSDVVIKALLLRAELQLEAKNLAAAVVDYKRLLSIDPSNVAVRIRAAELINSLGNYNDALSLIDAGGKKPRLLFVGALYAFEKNAQQQIQKNYSLLKKLKWNDKNEKYYFLGQIAELLMQYDVAKKWYNNINDEQYYSKAQIRMVNILIEESDYMAALEILNVLQNSEDDSIAARSFLLEGEVYRIREDYQQAYDVLTRAITVFPENYELLYARSLIAEQLNLIYITEADLKQILRLSPNDPDALNALGYTLITRTDRLEEGGTMIEKAFELRPNQPAIIDSMGWLMFKQGKYDYAVELLNLALSMGFNEEIAIHLLRALWASENYEKANEFFNETIEAHDSDQLVDFLSVFNELQSHSK